MPHSSIADLSFAIQTAKGTAASSATFRSYLMGGGVSPRRDVIDPLTHSQTGFHSVGNGILLRAERGVDGDPVIAVRPELAPLILYAALGTKAVSGASDPYTHTITAGPDLPWITVWRMIGSTLFEQFVDCKVAALVISSKRGSPLTMQAKIVGRTARFRTSNQAVTVTTSVPFLHTHAAGALKVEGAAVSAIREAVITIDNGLALRPGGFGDGWDIFGGFDRSIRIRTVQRASSLALYNRFHYGAASPASGTTYVDTIQTLTGGLDLKWTISASRSMQIVMPNVIPTAVDGWDADANDDLLTERREYLARSNPAILEEIITATVKNGVASY